MKQKTIERIKKINKVTKYLPIGSLFNHMFTPAITRKDNEEHNLKRELKTLAHVVYLAAFVGWGSMAINIQEINPVKQYRAAKQYLSLAQKCERMDINIKGTWKKAVRKENYWNGLFRDGGYANTDGKPGICFAEKAEAWRRMGYEGVLMEGEKFPKPTEDMLRKATLSYITEWVGELNNQEGNK